MLLGDGRAQQALRTAGLPEAFGDDAGLLMLVEMRNQFLGEQPPYGFAEGVVILEDSWEAVIERSGVTPVNGRVYTLVVMGPAVGDEPASFWNPLALSLVDSDPMLQ